MSEDYWAGATWVYADIITNDGSNSGNHTRSIVPGDGNEMELLYGLLFNGDASARAAKVVIGTGGGTPNFTGFANVMYLLLPTGLNLAATTPTPFPVSDDVGSGGASGQGARHVISSSMELFSQINSIAVSKPTRFAVACRIRGGIPTVTLTSPTDATEAVDINQVM